MCGVFSYKATGDKGPDLRRLEAIAVATEARGPHAFGFAWLNRRGGIGVYKQPGRISENLDKLEMLRDATLLIGHTRWATHGRPEDNRNNHPHEAGRGYIVHNGIFGGHREVARRFRLRLQTQCDSEVIGRLIGASGGDLLRRTEVAVKAGNYSPLVVLGIWKPRELVVARMCGQPLHAGADRRGAYLASGSRALPGDVCAMPDETLWRFGIGGTYERRPIRHPLRDFVPARPRYRNFAGWSEDELGWEDGR